MIDIYMSQADSRLEDAKDVVKAFSLLFGTFLFIGGLFALAFFL